MKDYYLRKAGMEDADLLLQWRNDEDTRRNSFSSEIIERKCHMDWLQKKMQSKDCKIFIFMKKDIPIGQIRLDWHGESWSISYSISASYRGQGFGKMIIELMENQLLREESHRIKVEAEVKKHNIASQLIFESLGYQQISRENIFYYTKKLTKQSRVREQMPISGGAPFKQ